MFMNKPSLYIQHWHIFFLSTLQHSYTIYILSATNKRHSLRQYCSFSPTVNNKDTPGKSENDEQEQQPMPPPRTQFDSSSSSDEDDKSDDDDDLDKIRVVKSPESASTETEETETNESTVWLGTEDGCIYLYDANDNIRIKKNKIKIQLGHAVLCIV